MKVLKQLEKFVKVNTLVIVLGVFVLFMAMRQFSKRKTVVANDETLETKSTPVESTAENDTPQFAEVNDSMDTAMLLPTGAPANIAPNLHEAGATIGMVSQCSKNANLQIRAEPPNPRGEAPRFESVIVPGPSTGLSDQMN